MSDLPPTEEKDSAKRRELGLRVLVLAALYSAAVAFAVMFSPSFGVAPARPDAPAANLAASPAPVAR